MPLVNPEILVWARETAGLTQQDAARKLGFRDSSITSAEEKLAALEHGQREPSRPLLVKMADQYRRPLLTFYLSKPPALADRGVDFRTLSNDHLTSDDAPLNALVRDIRARQSMVRAVMEDEDEAELLEFVGSHKLEDGLEVVSESLRLLFGVELAEYRAQSSTLAAFNLLRENAEDSGIFVLLKGDLGNYVTAIGTTVFRGFSIADTIAPFIIINDQDARAAWSFTLLHETVHLLLGQSGVSGEYSENEIERFCDDVAGNLLLPTGELDALALSASSEFEMVSEQLTAFANESKVSRTMVAYKAYRAQLINQETYVRLSTLFRQQWREERESFRARAREREGGPSYYTIRRHRLGGRLVNFVKRMMATDALSTSRASRILGIKSRQVQRLLDNGSGSSF